MKRKDREQEADLLCLWWKPSCFTAGCTCGICVFTEYIQYIPPIQTKTNHFSDSIQWLKVKWLMLNIPSTAISWDLLPDVRFKNPSSPGLSIPGPPCNKQCFLFFFFNLCHLSGHHTSLECPETPCWCYLCYQMSVAVRRSSVLSPSIQVGPGKHDCVGDTILERWLRFVQVNKGKANRFRASNPLMALYIITPTPHSFYECLSLCTRPFDSRAFKQLQAEVSKLSI